MAEFFRDTGLVVFVGFFFAGFEDLIESPVDGRKGLVVLRGSVTYQRNACGLGVFAEACQTASQDGRPIRMDDDHEVSAALGSEGFRIDFAFVPLNDVIVKSVFEMASGRQGAWVS